MGCVKRENKLFRSPTLSYLSPPHHPWCVNESRDEDKNEKTQPFDSWKKERERERSFGFFSRFFLVFLQLLSPVFFFVHGSSIPAVSLFLSLVLSPWFFQIGEVNLRRGSDQVEEKKRKVKRALSLFFHPSLSLTSLLVPRHLLLLLYLLKTAPSSA